MYMYIYSGCICIYIVDVYSGLVRTVLRYAFALSTSDLSLIELHTGHKYI